LSLFGSSSLFLGQWLNKIIMGSFHSSS
jgi:hypothetical protein